jgi:glutamate/tyrosine decarboxylase-like PLP-dependent enzyme
VIEEAAGEWIKSLLDLPREASFAFTTGCQLAHMTSLAAARYASTSHLTAASPSFAIAMRIALR